MKELNDVVENAGFFYPSALPSSACQLSVHMLLPHSCRSTAMVLLIIILKAEKKKANTKMGLYFYFLFPRSILRKRPLLSRWPDRTGTAVREAGEQASEVWGQVLTLA